MADKSESQSMFADIADFHEKFKLAYDGMPRQLDRELHNFRAGFMTEELGEYVEAHEAGDLEGQIDALVDLVYVVLGTAYLQGFPFDEAWKRVHAANMSKIRALRPDQSKRGSVYDVVKPPGFVPPDHSDLIANGKSDVVDWGKMK